MDIFRRLFGGRKNPNLPLQPAVTSQTAIAQTARKSIALLILSGAVFVAEFALPIVLVQHGRGPESLPPYLPGCRPHRMKRSADRRPHRMKRSANRNRRRSRIKDTRTSGKFGLSTSTLAASPTANWTGY